MLDPPARFVKRNSCGRPVQVQHRRRGDYGPRMPIASTELKSASGHAVLRSVYQEPITVADAEKFIASVRDGAPYRHHGHLIVGQLTSVSGEVRKVLTSEKADPANPPPVAMVMQSALIRMISSLAMRGGGNENLEFFKDEASALTWLDAQMATYEAKRKATPAAGTR